MINSDSYYEIGAGHTFCQDYAMSGKFVQNNNQYHYAIVCDGCSGSTDSDIGARWLAKNFAKAVQFAIAEGTNLPLHERIQAYFLANMNSAIKEMAVNMEAFDATVVAILYDEVDDALHSFVWGDGKVFYKYKTEHGYLTDIGYLSNAPYYLTYRNHADRDARYEATFGNLYADIAGYVVKDDALIHLPEAFRSKQKFHYEKYSKASETLAFASVFTDGIDTYHRKDDVDILLPKANLYNQLTQYKNIHGEFVKRRMQKVKQFCQKEGWQHFDDISVATITF